MNYNIDEYKINHNKLYLNGWVHCDHYTIKVISGEESKTINHYVSRYDICMAFHEKIEDNHYGFNEELTFQFKIKKAKIYLISERQEQLIFTIDNRKLIVGLMKIKKKLGKVKRGLKFLWREYHFLVPPAMMKKYIKMLFHKKTDVSLYNPEIQSEYEEWFQNHVSHTVKKVEPRLSFLGKSSVTSKVLEISHEEKLKNINTKYTCIVDNDITLVDSFYYEIEKSLDDGVDLLYFDNDFLNNGKLEKPMLKPDWSPDTLFGVNYIGHCFIVKTKILEDLKLDDYNSYNILLHFLFSKKKIRHLAKVLYHDTKEISNGKKYLEKYLEQNHIKAKIQENQDGFTNTVIYEILDQPKVSIIIPTKDHADILEKCLESIYQKTTYRNYEIIVIDNNSTEEETFQLLKKYSQKKNFKSKRIECEFNYSYLNNEASKLAEGEYLLLLNNDIEVITPKWLEFMLGYASQDHIGVVGAKLIFPDETIQHAGIIMGKGGLAGHAHYGKRRNYQSLQYELRIPYDYSACTAACFMVSKKKFEEVGGLEETLKVAFNDVDFNLKLLDKGYNNIFLPNVELYHYESKSRGLDTTPEKQKRFVQEWSYIADKWKKYIDHDPFYNDNFSKDHDYMLK